MPGILMADEAKIRRIIEAAGAAPSIHNSQPWRFVVVADDLLEVHADPVRGLMVADPQARALHLSCGAALFNIRLAIKMASYNPLVWSLPPERPTLLAMVRAEPGRPPTFADRGLYEAIWRRRTNRGPFADEVLPESVQVALEQAAGFEFATLRLLTPWEAESVLDLAAEADQELAANQDHLAELRRWIATGSLRDGIPAPALPPQPDRGRAPVRDFGPSARSAERPTRTFERYPQLAVLTTARDEPADWLRAGQALQRVLLTATMHGVSASFLYQPIELRDVRGGAAPAWPWPENPQIIVRLGYGPPALKTPRRRPDEIVQHIAARP